MLTTTPTRANTSVRVSRETIAEAIFERGEILLRGKFGVAARRQVLHQCRGRIGPDHLF